MRNFCRGVFILCGGGSGSAAVAAAVLWRWQLRYYGGGFLGDGGSGSVAAAGFYLRRRWRLKITTTAEFLS
jgi:hypothetical protein